MSQVRWSLPAIGIAATLLASYRPVHSSSSADGPATGASTEVLVAAAADLRFAMDSLVAVFSRENPGITIKPTYGSSGNFFQQIQNDAPFDLFFSADMDYPKKLESQNLALSPVKQYATGQIVLWSKKLDPSSGKMNSLLNSAVRARL